ncbi:MAG TPA: hypothetical protein PLV70_02500 [Flavobacteriales bacterium]|nr:hypothetical protein [Flavobacteriales bacterium]HRO39699.1 hypothetical protein [Flavobacteriales bacterium]HRP81855.1 hypothetical protein [Flavobacteriales bacterium]HRQ83966.1 hypothetical protein [Flavobacteriales bacterium]
MRKAVLLALFLPHLASAQMLSVEPGAEDPAVLRFNPAFIARNGVTSVAGQAWVKREGRPMQPLDRFYLYRFAPDGRLGYANNSFGKPGSGVDTASVMYTYDANGKLLQELHNDINGYYALRNGHDAEGRVVHMEHVRLENLGTGRYHFVEGPSTIVSDERLQYAALNDTMWTVTRLNDQGRPYQEETFTRNRLGYLLAIDRLNLITRKRGRTSFTYDGRGRLARRDEQPDLNAQHWSTWQWTYDKAGNPLSCDLSRDGSLRRHSEYLYAEGTMFLKAIVAKNEETGTIDIIRYTTTR